MELDFLQRVKDFRPSESYTLTYSFDFQYYEGYFLPILQRLGCNKNVVVADGNKFNDEIEHSLAYISRLGTEYVILPLHCSQAFHPKVYLFKKTKKEKIHLLCIIGSGNLTYPGLNTNHELFIDLEWTGDDPAPYFWKSLFDYFNLIFGTYSGQTLSVVRRWLKRGYPEKFKKEDNSFKLITYPSKSNILSQFLSSVQPGSGKKVFVMAPFYDNDLSALKTIVGAFKSAEVEIALQAATTQISSRALNKVILERKKIKLFSFLPKEKRRRYLHAKLLVATTGSKDYALIGSANISDAALLARGQNGNYEACVYTETPKNQILKQLDLYEKVNETLLADITVTEPEAKRREKTQAPEAFLIATEFYLGKYWFIITEQFKKYQADIELLFTNGQMTKIKAQQDRKNPDTYTYIPETLQRALTARMCGTGRWFPVLYMDSIHRLGLRTFVEVDAIRNAYLTATTDDEQFHYLNCIIDYIVTNSLKDVEREEQSFRRSVQDVSSKALPADSKVVIEVDSQGPKKRASDITWGTVEGGFVESFDYVLTALREKRRVSQIEEEIPDSELKDNYKQYDEVIQGKVQEQAVRIDTLEIISQKLKSRRRMFNRNESIQNPFVRMCFFALVAMPHIPRLHRFFIKDKERQICIEDKDWEEFIAKAALTIGRCFFMQGKIESVWPKIQIDNYRADMFNLSASSVLYCCATVYPFIVHRAGYYDDVGRRSRLILNRMHCLCAALLGIVRELNKGDIAPLKTKISEIIELFPCAWVHLPKSIDEIWGRSQEYADLDFEHRTKNDAGELSWQKKKGFMLKIDGFPMPLWEDPNIF